MIFFSNIFVEVEIILQFMYTGAFSLSNQEIIDF